MRERQIPRLPGEFDSGIRLTQVCKEKSPLAIEVTIPRVNDARLLEKLESPLFSHTAEMVDSCYLVALLVCRVEAIDIRLLSGPEGRLRVPAFASVGRKSSPCYSKMCVPPEGRLQSPDCSLSFAFVLAIESKGEPIECIQ